MWVSLEGFGACSQEHLQGIHLIFIITVKHTFLPHLPISCHVTSFISFQVHIRADSLSRQLNISPCKTHSFCALLSACQLCFLLSTRSGSDFFSVSRSLDTLLLFLCTQIDFPPCYILPDYYCHRPDGCLLCNTNTGCYHNSLVPARITKAESVMRLDRNQYLLPCLHVCACTMGFFGPCYDNLHHQNTSLFAFTHLMPREISFQLKQLPWDSFLTVNDKLHNVQLCIWFTISISMCAKNYYFLHETE